MKKNNKIIGLIKSIYAKIFLINDTPQKIALGLGLGVFLGILPGVGPVAALVLAGLFRVNRATAVLGSLATNTWLSLVTFILSIKVGSAIIGANWKNVYHDALTFIKHFHSWDLFKVSVLQVALPLAIGYLVVSFCLGLIAYLITLTILTNLKKPLR